MVEGDDATHNPSWFFRFGRRSAGRRAVLGAAADAQQARFRRQQRIPTSSQSSRLLHGPLLGGSAKGGIEKRHRLLGEIRLPFEQIYPRRAFNRNEVHEAKIHGRQNYHSGGTVFHGLTDF